MEKNIFIEFIAGMVPLAPVLRKVLRQQLKSETIHAGQVLLQEGQVCRHIYFLIRGLAYSYYDHEGRSHTLQFFGKNEFAFPWCSYFYQVSSRESISVIQDGICLSLSYEQILVLENEYPQFQILMKMIRQRGDLHREEELRSGLRLSPRERFKKLKEKFPDIVRQAGLKKIASYLNITPEALSRMKKKIAADNLDQFTKEDTIVNLVMQENREEYNSIDHLFGLLGSKVSLSQGLKDFSRENLTELRYRKQTKLMSPERVVDTVWYLESGLAKEYYYDKDGKEIITAFWKENEIIMAFESLFEGSLPQRYIELIEDSQLLAMSFEHIQKAYRTWPESNVITRFIQIEDKRKSDFRAAIVTMSAAEKYALFCKEFPWHRISSKDTCSYLHMAPQTLSQMRGQNDSTV